MANQVHYWHQDRLCLQTGSQLPTAQSLMTKQGLEQQMARLVAEPQANQLLTALQQAYQQGYEQQASNEFELKGVAFAGIGDPLLHLDLLAQVLPSFKAERHGVPISLVSYGLLPSDQIANRVQQLLALEVERLELYFPAAEPQTYLQRAQPLAQGFAELCQLILQASEQGLAVSCFADAPAAEQAQLRSLALDLGARSFHRL